MLAKMAGFKKTTPFQHMSFYSSNEIFDDQSDHESFVFLKKLYVICDIDLN